MSRFRALVHEIHRRSLWQVLAIYVAASWVVLEVAGELTQTLGLPDWVPPLSVVLLMIGLPIVLATAFVQEGIAPSRPEPPGEPVAARESAPAPVTAGAHVAQPEVRHRRLLTWRNALGGGLVAFAGLGLLTALYMGSRALGIGPAATLLAQGVLEERSTLLVAEFDASDEVLSRAATEALRVDMAQSSVVRLASPAQVTEALARMEREPGVTLDVDLAREVARREGMAAVVAGEIHRAGSGYVLTARLVSPTDGESLASVRETAPDSTALIAAIDRLSKGIRERIGESLRTIRAQPPLERVTTADLGALEKYSEAQRLLATEGSSDRVVGLLADAVAADSGFAMAWRQLGIELRNRGSDQARATAALIRAFQHQDRLPELERYHTRASYFQSVTNEQDRAVLEYEKVLGIDPEDHAALNNTGIAYALDANWSRAAEWFRRAAAVDPDNFRPFYNVIEATANEGRLDEAAMLVDSAKVRFPESPNVAWTEAHLAATAGDHARAYGLLQVQRTESAGRTAIRALLDADLAALAGVQGRLVRADGHLRDALAGNAERDAPGDVWIGALQWAWLDLLVRGDPPAALQRIERVEAQHPWSALAPLDRPYLDLAALYARAGRVARARELVAGFESDVPVELRQAMGTQRRAALGEIALAEGDLDAAIEAFRAADRGYCTICMPPALALAYERAARTDEAIAALERYVATPWFYRFFGAQYPLGPLLGPALERLAQLHDEAGNAQKAARYYAQFVELWAQADAELQPRVRAARRRLSELLQRRG